MSVRNGKTPIRLTAGEPDELFGGRHPITTPNWWTTNVNEDGYCVETSFSILLDRILAVTWQLANATDINDEEANNIGWLLHGMCQEAQEFIRVVYDEPRRQEMVEYLEKSKPE